MQGRGGGHRGERTGRGGEGELSAGLPATDQPLLPVLKKQAAAAGEKRGEDEQCLSVKF